MSAGARPLSTSWDADGVRADGEFEKLIRDDLERSLHTGVIGVNESGMRTGRVLSSRFSMLPPSVTGKNRLTPEWMTWCSVVIVRLVLEMSSALVVTHAIDLLVSFTGYTRKGACEVTVIVSCGMCIHTSASSAMLLEGEDA